MRLAKRKRSLPRCQQRLAKRCGLPWFAVSETLRRMFSLKGKNAVVTGAGSGIGQAIALAFAKQGARVDVLEINTEAAGETVKKIRSEGGEADAVECDVTRHDHVQEVFDKLGTDRVGLDCLVNNAGIAHVGNITNTSEADFDRVISVNLKGVFNCLKGGVQQMLKSGGGSIVNISSTAGFRATPGIAAYGASKGAVRQLTKSVAAYCGRQGYNIRCNSIHPGMVRTPLGEAVLSYYGELEETAKKRTTTVPLGRLGEVEDVANAALFLASDESRYINSTELVIDGGMLGGG